MYNVSIIGAGASGLVLAILLAREGKKVILFEKNKRVGKRILATGNGRCNITNINISSNNFHSKNPKFIEKSILSYRDIEKFFNSIGIFFTSLDDNRVFPLSLQAVTVVEILEYELNRLKVRTIFSKVEDIKKEENSFKIFYENGKYISSKEVVIATGNISNSKLGGSSSGLDFAKNFKHKLTPLFPSLVQLTSSIRGLKRVAGVRVEARVSYKKISIDGDILFTNYGISGLAILDISFYIVEELNKKGEITLTIDLMPSISQRELFNMLLKSIKIQSNREVSIWLRGFLNRKLIEFIGLNWKKDIKSLSKKEISSIVESIKSFKFRVNGTRGFESAEVIRGGVDTKYINPNTMESKLIKGLYFIGEVLDVVDGKRGGYNLHFAWSSAIRARGAICL